jgi:hypothetical protein
LGVGGILVVTAGDCNADDYVVAIARKQAMRLSVVADSKAVILSND